MTTADEKRFDYLRYINTILIAFILAFSVMCWNGIKSVKSIQEDTGRNLVLIQERQSVQLLNINALEARLKILELNQTDLIKNWTEQWFVRKPVIK